MYWCQQFGFPPRRLVVTPLGCCSASLLGWHTAVASAARRCRQALASGLGNLGFALARLAETCWRTSSGQRQRGEGRRRVRSLALTLRSIGLDFIVIIATAPSQQSSVNDGDWSECEVAGGVHKEFSSTVYLSLLRIPHDGNNFFPRHAD